MSVVWGNELKDSIINSKLITQAEINNIKPTNLIAVYLTKIIKEGKGLSTEVQRVDGLPNPLPSNSSAAS